MAKLKDGIFSIKSFHSSFPNGRIEDPFMDCLEYLGSIKDHLFCLESYMGKYFDDGLVQRREWIIPYICYLCKEKEEIIDHILIHYSKVVISWQPIFALFGI